MADVKSDHLRIFCICGQKMKVSQKMFGLPGKCVACRQKIRIPGPEEIEDGQTDFYLKDHPELLRGPVKSTEEIEEEREAARALAGAGRSDHDDDSTPITELDLAEGATPGEPLRDESRKPRPGATLPLDTLATLRVLCSLEHKLKRQLETLELYEPDDEKTKAEVMGHLARAARVRTEQDDHLHQLLMEVAIELTNTQEKIAHVRLSARVAEISYTQYQDTVYRLRSRRDRLERRQQNLRGWLGARDPYTAGGFVDLSIDSLPEQGYPVKLPPEPEAIESPLNVHTAGLRAAMTQRMHASQKLSELERMATEEDAGDSLSESLLEAQHEKSLAKAAMAFYLGRLDRLKKDYASDLETINAQLDIAVGRLKIDDISRAEFDGIERALLRAKKDIARAQTVVARALSANASTDVPSPRGTFLDRIGLAQASGGSPEALVTVGASCALFLAIFLPSVGDISLVGALVKFYDVGGINAWALLGPLLAAGAVFGTLFVRNAEVRGWILLGVWAVGLFAAAFWVLNAHYGLGPLQARFRTGTIWWMRPGTLLIVIGGSATAVAGLRSVWVSEKFRLWALYGVVLSIGFATLILSNFAGALAERPTIEVALGQHWVGGREGGTVRVGNTGVRTVFLMSRPSDARSAYLFLLERRVGTNSWNEVGSQVLRTDREASATGLLRSVASGQTLDIPILLEPGDYRVLLLSSATGREIGKNFTIDVFEPAEPVAAPVETRTPPVVEPAPSPEAEAPASEELPAEQAFTDIVQVELKGIMTSPEGATRFRFTLFFPDGTETPLMLSLGDPLWGEWDVSEYNPAFRTVTLSNEDGLLVLRRRTRTDLIL